MTPILEGTMNWESNREATRCANAVKGDMFLCMLMNEQHEARTDMVHAFLCELADSMGNRYWSGFSDNNVSLTSDPKKFRTKFNTWINYYGEFNDSFEEYREVK